MINSELCQNMRGSASDVTEEGRGLLLLPYFLSSHLGSLRCLRFAGVGDRDSLLALAGVVADDVHVGRLLSDDQAKLGKKIPAYLRVQV